MKIEIEFYKNFSRKKIFRIYFITMFRVKNMSPMFTRQNIQCLINYQLINEYTTIVKILIQNFI